MPGYDLPTSVTVGGKEWDIRSDYRAALDIIKVMGDPDLGDAGRSALVLTILYPDIDDMPRNDMQEAIERLLWFVGGGGDTHKGGKRPRVMDWEQDFPLIVAPINRVLGYEIRACDYLHWWSLLAAYYEIGDCLFAQVVAIRKKRMAGKKLDKADAKFYRDNRDIIDLKVRESDAESELFSEWIG